MEGKQVIKDFGNERGKARRGKKMHVYEDN